MTNRMTMTYKTTLTHRMTMKYKTFFPLPLFPFRLTRTTSSHFPFPFPSHTQPPSHFPLPPPSLTTALRFGQRINTIKTDTATPDRAARHVALSPLCKRQSKGRGGGVKAGRFRSRTELNNSMKCKITYRACWRVIY